MSPEARVVVLLGAYNGRRYLVAQLDSLKVQRGVALRLIISDDGSTDGTPELVNAWARRNAEVNITFISGPGRGYAANFLTMASHRSAEEDYVAYADQDDVWDPDKLARATAALKACDAASPALYCGRTRSLSEQGHVDGQSPYFGRAASFRNALVQNIAGGNTMVMNRAAHRLIVSAGVVDVVAHDWWTYLLVTACGGTIIYDPEPALSYRQHAGNIIGANTGVKRRVLRYAGFLSGRNRLWNERNIEALEACSHLMPPENRELLAIFRAVRGDGVCRRLSALRKGGFYAQTTSGNAGLRFATLLKRI